MVISKYVMMVYQSKISILQTVTNKEKRFTASNVHWLEWSVARCCFTLLWFPFILIKEINSWYYMNRITIDITKLVLLTPIESKRGVAFTGTAWRWSDGENMIFNSIIGQLHLTNYFFCRLTSNIKSNRWSSR